MNFIREDLNCVPLIVRFHLAIRFEVRGWRKGPYACLHFGLGACCLLIHLTEVVELPNLFYAKIF
jgi:hypothetical protein